MVDVSRVFVVDIDNTICRTEGAEYFAAQPLLDRIAIINRLFQSGHRIVYFTARGSTTGIDWREVTENQLEAWGALHHELLLGKPYGDFYIDDKAWPLDRFDELSRFIG